MTQISEQLCELQRGAGEVLRELELAVKLKLRRPLPMMAGFDPTAPDLRLGRVVLSNKLRQFQNFGHGVSFLIGEFTATPGDPSGKSAARPVLTRKKILANAGTYADAALELVDPILQIGDNAADARL